MPLFIRSFERYHLNIKHTVTFSYHSNEGILRYVKHQQVRMDKNIPHPRAAIPANHVVRSRHELERTPLALIMTPSRSRAWMKRFVIHSSACGVIAGWRTRKPTWEKNGTRSAVRAAADARFVTAGVRAHWNRLTSWWWVPAKSASISSPNFPFGFIWSAQLLLHDWRW